jgi:hypothetical protein
MNIDEIRRSIRQGSYTISFTHTEKLRRRKIELAVIEEAVSNGQIIESYPDDPRGPSCLLLGFTNTQRPIHVVCGHRGRERILIITAYEPDREEWEPDWKTRKRKIQP